MCNICSTESEAHQHDDNCYAYKATGDLKKLSHDLAYITENHFSLQTLLKVDQQPSADAKEQLVLDSVAKIQPKDEPMDEDGQSLQEGGAKSVSGSKSLGYEPNLQDMAGQPHSPGGSINAQPGDGPNDTGPAGKDYQAG